MLFFCKQKPLYYHNTNANTPVETGLAVWITKRIVLLHYETAGCGSCIASRNTAFRSDDNSPSTGHLTRKALLCVFAQEKILPFHFSMFSSVCKEVF